jgi:ribonuclease J
MNIQVASIGGYSEVGKNMTAVKIDDEVVILDMGFYLQKLVDFEESGGSRFGLSREKMIKTGAIPNDNILDSWKDKVKAIALSHVHLDHIGAVPFLASRYKAPVYGTAFTNEVLRESYYNDGKEVKNNIIDVKGGSTVRISKNIELEFINVAHSSPQCCFVLIKTKKGSVLYAADFKFDNNPGIGKKTDVKRIKKLAGENVKAVIVDSLYSRVERKTPSEFVAKEMLREVLLETDNYNNAILGTCFSSHIARLKSFIEYGKKIDRKVVLMGRSIRKYGLAAQKVGITDFNGIKFFGFKTIIEKQLKKINKEGPEKYLIVMTGGQAESGSVLNKIVNGDLEFKFIKDDQVIFSNRTIPVEPNIANREKMELKLKKQGVRIFKDVHISGHCSREDIRDLIEMVNPEVVIPFHGDRKIVEPVIELGQELGYKNNRDIFLMKDGTKLNIQ